MGFMVHDYVNFGFDEADVIVSVGYELQEFAPAWINPLKDKQIIHLHRFGAVVDTHYNVTVDVTGDIPAALNGTGRPSLPQAGAGGHRAQDPLPAPRRNWSGDGKTPPIPSNPSGWWPTPAPPWAGRTLSWWTAAP